MDLYFSFISLNFFVWNYVKKINVTSSAMYYYCCCFIRCSYFLWNEEGLCIEYNHVCWAGLSSFTPTMVSWLSYFFKFATFNYINKYHYFQCVGSPGKDIKTCWFWSTFVISSLSHAIVYLNLLLVSMTLLLCTFIKLNLSLGYKCWVLNMNWTLFFMIK